MCELCYAERLLHGKLTGYGYELNPYQLLNSTLGNMDTTNGAGMFVGRAGHPHGQRSCAHARTKLTWLKYLRDGQIYDHDALGGQRLHRVSWGATLTQRYLTRLTYWSLVNG